MRLIVGISGASGVIMGYQMLKAQYHTHDDGDNSHDDDIPGQFLIHRK